MESRKGRSDSARKLLPMFEMSEMKKNKDLLRLKHDFEERARSGRVEGRGWEVLYVDATRNVGVVMGEKDIGADMRRRVDTR